MKQSQQYNRAEAMVLADKFNYHQTEFFAELNNLVARYMEFDSMTVDVERGANSNMVLTISVKKVKPTFRPLS